MVFKIMFFFKYLTKKKKGEKKEPTKWFGALGGWLAAVLVLNHTLFVYGSSMHTPVRKWVWTHHCTRPVFKLHACTNFIFRFC